ncbi:MAG TPA: xanthine dehydrogenase family protein molybdopterin-binding subunit [Xanthobacteraceae bacterium]|jgi:carbon-monoxide dehydrogenase large subunit|nr:xanthine dehydrogenase family protein molybdopterin-binding subunit [Xanthobacteraceae bacterium]
MRNSFVGSPVERREDLRFVRGRGQYVDDLNPDGLLHAVILRSSFAHGRIRSIDASATVKLAGVHAVITARDMPGGPPRIPMRLQPLPEFMPFEQGVIADTKVRYVGEPIAVVVATSVAVGEDALDHIVVDIEPLPAVSDCETSAAGDRLLFEQQGANCAMTFTAECGDADAAFKAAAYVRREKFRTGRHFGLTLEPRGVMAEWDAATGRLTVSGAAKVPFFNRRVLAEQMGLPEDSIAMIENDVGGGFGARGEFYPEDFLIPFAARYTGRPVKWIEDRRENLMAMNHARQAQVEVEIACAHDGTILALRGHAHVDMGAYMRTNGAVAARNIAQFMAGPYRIPNIRVKSSLWMTNKTPVGTYRGPGRFETDFFRERLLDMVAKDLRLDRVELRRRNLIPASHMPYPLPAIAPFPASDEIDSGDYRATLDRCLEEFGWADKAKLAGKLIDGRFHGLAVGCFIEGGAAGPKETARLEINPDGSVAVFIGSSAVGQGVETVFAQIAADALEIPMDRISGVHHGSTAYVSDGYGAYHSRSVVMGGSALLDATKNLHNLIRTAAAKRFGCLPSEIKISEDGIVGPHGSSARFADFAGLTAEGAFLNKKHTYTFGAHAAHVTVDARIGRIEIIDYLAVTDCGRIINPMTVRGQVIGSLVQGLGGALLEDLKYDKDGQLLTGSLADYLLPSASDFPNLRAVVTEMFPSPINPLGAKGAGEGGIISAGGVVANAVANALGAFGVEPRELPLTPQRVWEMVEAGRLAT